MTINQRLHERLLRNEEAGWEHVAHQQQHDRLRDRIRFVGLVIENRILRILAR